MNSKPGNPPGTTFLTGKQAAEILEKLKGIKNMDGQSIKIRTVQTNPQTGLKKIVAIPIQSAPASSIAGTSNLSVSPMKTLKTSDSTVLLTSQPGISIGSAGAGGGATRILSSSPRTTASFSNVSLVRTIGGGSGAAVSGTSSTVPSVTIQQTGGHATAGISLQHHQPQGGISVQQPNVVKLQSHTLIQPNITLQAANSMGPQATVMSQQRVTLTPQKSIISVPPPSTSSIVGGVAAATPGVIATASNKIGMVGATKFAATTSGISGISKISSVPSSTVAASGGGTAAQPPPGLTAATASSQNASIIRGGSGIGGLELGEFVSAKRPLDIDSLEMSEAKRRKTEKGGKGLRHFSMKVCEKVKAKGTTSYNEVADELVAELTDPRYQSPSDPTYDQKNIRRRVYDALNVLMAMNIISKEKKEIRWLGLPTNSVQEVSALETEKAERINRINLKTKQLQDLILQQIAFKNLVERNRETEKTCGLPTPNSAIQLPFIIVGTSKRTVIDCSISNDKMEYLFNFDNTFEIHDDMEVLKKMKMTMGLESGHISPEDLNRAKSMVPKALQSYVEQMARTGVMPAQGLSSKPNIKTETDGGGSSALDNTEDVIEDDSDD
eukprot:TRINITY_DN13063_c0_g1_i1.p1 TRINITY_DN13063_c0_g1~~TRINITY_DN13063_c0_g1_i1.p1  ORF type:complete len:611 (-),score=190.28 TRINITY_DN13063_c0_g1_i1:169-2001(-)